MKFKPEYLIIFTTIIIILFTAFLTNYVALILENGIRRFFGIFTVVISWFLSLMFGSLSYQLIFRNKKGKEE